MDAIFAEFDQLFGWVPLWFVGLAIVAAAIVAALFVHSIAIRLTRRMLRTKFPVAMLFLDKTSGPTQLALCLAAVAFVLPLAPLNDALRQQLSHFFAVAVIALIGWLSIRAVDMPETRRSRGICAAKSGKGCWLLFAKRCPKRCRASARW